MRSGLRFLFPLAVLVATPLLGVGGRAQAGYTSPVSLGFLPHADSLLGAAPAADPSPIGLAASEDFGSMTESRPEDGPTGLEPLDLPQPGRGMLALSPSGAGSQPSPGAPGAGGPNQVPAATSRPAADAPVLVGVLFLETVSRRPPPFPPRFFRPPRLS